jgi:hypothetical protein
VSSPGLLTPDGSEPKAANNKKPLFGLSMKWRSDKKVLKVLLGPSFHSLDLACPNSSYHDKEPRPWGSTLGIVTFKVFL